MKVTGPGDFVKGAFSCPQPLEIAAIIEPADDVPGSTDGWWKVSDAPPLEASLRACSETANVEVHLEYEDGVDYQGDPRRSRPRSSPAWCSAASRAEGHHAAAGVGFRGAGPATAGEDEAEHHERDLHRLRGDLAAVSDHVQQAPNASGGAASTKSSASAAMLKQLAPAVERPLSADWLSWWHRTAKNAEAVRRPTSPATGPSSSRPVRPRGRRGRSRSRARRHRGSAAAPAAARRARGRGRAGRRGRATSRAGRAAGRRCPGSASAGPTARAGPARSTGLQRLHAAAPVTSQASPRARRTRVTSRPPMKSRPKTTTHTPVSPAPSALVSSTSGA